MNFRLGMEAVINYKVGGQDEAGSWTELGDVRDVNLNLETGEADVTTRANQGWRATVATLRDMTVELEMVWNSADAGFSAIRNAWLNNAIIGLQVLTDASGEGPQADFMITNFSRSEPLEEAITVSVTAKATLSETPPSWIGGS